MAVMRRSRTSNDVRRYFTQRHRFIILICLGLVSVGVYFQLFESMLNSKSIEQQIHQLQPPIETPVETEAPQQSLSTPETQPIPQTETSQVKSSQPSPAQTSPKETVDGMAIVMFSHLKTTDRFDNLFFPALETWWQNETEPLYIVLTHEWEDDYQKMCQGRDCSRFYPLWVDCPEAQFGESACCKQEKGLLALPKDYEWTLFADDDMYLKVGPIRQYLTKFLAVDPSEAYLVTAGGVSPKVLGQSGYKGWESPYKCSNEEDYRYPWGQPVIYSRAALHLVQPGLRAGGLVKQCLEFQLTHDTGNSVFHWMYQIPDYAVRVHMFPQAVTRREMMGVHGIHRFVKKVDRIVTMKEVHSQVLNSTQSLMKYMKERHHHKGYLETETFAKFGDPSTWGDDEWHTMPVRDCMDKEMKNKLG